MAWWEIKQFPNLLKFDWGRQETVSLLKEEDPNDIRVRREQGATGNEVWGGSVRWEDYNPLMTGAPFFDLVDKMRKGDGSVSAVLKLIKLPFLRTTWNIVPENPDETDGQNLLIAKTCHEKLIGSTSMYSTWDERLRDILLMFDYGFTVQEKVFEVDKEGFLRYSKLALRMARTITDFKVEPDGTINRVLQNAWKDGRVQDLVIPKAYQIVYSWEKEGDNYWGNSVLRPIYKHYFYKEEMYRIDAVRLDKWAIGIPDAKIMNGKTLKPGERANLEKILKGMRGNDRGFLVHPEEIDISILTPKGNGDLGLMNSVNHHDVMMFRSLLTQFMTTGSQEHGSYGSTRSYIDMFLFAMQAAANFIQDQFGKQVIKQFCDLNFNMAERPYPVLRSSDIQKIEIGLLAESLGRFATSKVITPDDDLESFLRKMYGWPRLPKDMTREAMRKKAEADLAAAAAAGQPISQGGRPTENNPADRPVDAKPGAPQ